MVDHKDRRRPQERLLTSSVATAVVLLALQSVPHTAQADDFDVDKCTGTSICLDAESSGKPGGRGAGSGEGSSKKCSLRDGTSFGCRSGFSNKDHCFYKPISQPEGGKKDTRKGNGSDRGKGDWFIKDCLTGGPEDGKLVFLEDPPETVLPDPEELAQKALNKMTLLGADIGSAPSPNKRKIVGVPVWLWNRKSDQTWGPISATASVPGMSVTAHAHVTKITYKMGDGKSVTCTGAGTPYKKSYGGKPSPDCGHRYTKVSTHEPDGKFTITATSTWKVTWEASTGEDGTLPAETRTSTTTARVGELQVVN